MKLLKVLSKVNQIEKIAYGNNSCYWRLFTNGDLRAIGGSIHGNDISAGVSAGTTVWLKGGFVKGTGANGVCWLTYWTGSAWATKSIADDGDLVTDETDWRFTNGQDGTGVEYQYFDEFHLFDEEFTGDPTTL